MNLFGWDTAYAVDIRDANSALSQTASTLIPGFNSEIHSQLGDFNIEVKFGQWQIVTGGSNGALLNLEINFQTGTLTSSNSSPIDLAGAAALMQISLALLPSPTDPAVKVLRFAFEKAGTLGGQGYPGLVLPLGFSKLPPAVDVQAIILNALAQALVDHANELSFIFASINPVQPGAESWLAPQNVAYAYFELNSPKRGYLVLLSSAQPIDNLPLICDPALVKQGSASSGFAFSNQLYFKNVILPGLLASLPAGTPADAFVINSGAVTSLSLRPGTSISLGGMKEAAITYYPRMSRMVATAHNNSLNVQASGDCDFYAGLSGSWNVTANNAFYFNSDNKTISFLSDPNPNSGYDIDIPWYWIPLGPVIYGICAAVVSLIARGLVKDLSDKISGNFFPAVPPSSVHFIGASSFVADSVTMEDAIVMTSK